MMHASRSSRIAAGGLLLTTLYWASTGAAQETPSSVKRECAESAERAQRDFMKGAVAEARVELRVCAVDVCPRAVRVDCKNWLAELDKQVPESGGAPPGTGPQGRNPDSSVAVPSASGLPAGDADAKANEPTTGAAERSSGESPGAPRPSEGAVATQLQLSESTKAWSSPVGREPSPRSSSSTLRTFAWGFTGLSALALGSFAYFGITGTTNLNTLKGTCGERCAQSDVNAAWNRLVIADVSLGVAGASGAVAAALFFVSRGSSASTRVAGIVGAVGGFVSRSGAVIDYRVRF
jgi:hypothetical protein